VTERPKLLDLFCGAGGASVGYHRAGFDVTGVDVVAQKHYPYRFIQGDALTVELEGYDVIHASPPCQLYSITQYIRGREHPDLVEPMRARLREWGGLYVIENVVGAPLVEPITLCGRHFGLELYRHRLFESNAGLREPPLHPVHLPICTPIGEKHRPGDYMTVAGHFSSMPAAKRAMGIDWMNRAELGQAIPPAYTEYIGKQLIERLGS
jgi:DNA (cytosine-5)-methyltransferase 1